MSITTISNQYSTTPRLCSPIWARAIAMLVAAGWLCDAGALTSPVRADDSAATQHFEKRVRPLLIAQCVKCHGAEKAESGLRLDQGAGIERGGDSGAVIRAGKPDESLLIQAVRQTGELKMPPGKKLSDAEIRDLETWVRNGAKWPTDSNAGKRDSRSLIEQAKATLDKRNADMKVRAKVDRTGDRLPVETKTTRFPPSLRDVVELWLSANTLTLADHEPVTIWPDVSGHERHATPTVGRAGGTGTAPLFFGRSDVSGRAAVRFQRDNGLATPGDKPLPITGDASYSMLIVATLRQRFEGYPYDGLLGFGEPASPSNPGRPRAGLLHVDRTGGGWRLSHAGGWNHDALLPHDSLRPWHDRPLSLVVVKRPGPMRSSTKFFVNGEPLALPITGSDTIPDITPRADMGAFIGHVMPWWNGIVGDVAEVAIFSRSLSDAEVAAVCESSRSHARQSVGGQHDVVAPGQTHVLANVATKSESHDALWAFRPVRVLEPPSVTRGDWPKTGVDHFVMSKLEGRGLTPAPPADRRTLIRRAYFDLLGLPPSPEQVESFANDPGNDREVLSRLVEQLLASPQYGERWGRHWLDVARYADSGGYETDIYFKNAWRYRDYVLKSFNDDKPYDVFVQEQLAGDELWPGNLNLEGKLLLPESQRRKLEARMGTGLFALGPQIHESNMDAGLIAYEKLTDWVDTAGAAFLGLTVGCARCHDHKFDPISQRDYFALQAAFAPSGEFDEPIITPMEQTDFKQHYPRIIAVDEARRAIRLFEQSFAGRAANADEQTKLSTLRNALAQTVLDMPGGATSTPTTPWDGIMEVPTATTLARLRLGLIPTVRLLNRGELSRPREEVSAAIPELLAFVTDTKQPLPSPDGSRAGLARWLTRPDHPLTARVMVNRLWQGHFGEGLVRTPNDFGKMGAQPTHPELLDWLAGQFVRRGWSVKEMHRLILNSATWQMSSLATDPRAVEADPDNTLLTRMNRRRLESEALWDAVHSASGSLNLKAGGRPVMPALEADELAAIRDKYHWVVTADVTEHSRRGLYMMSRRNFRMPIFDVFDSPPNAVSTGRRDSTTVAPQALWTLNNRRVFRLAELFAARLTREAGEDPAAQVDRAWQIVVARRPTEAERAESRALLDSLAVASSRPAALTTFCLAMFNLNEFLYVE